MFYSTVRIKEMKLKYYMCGLGSGIILAVLVLMIANKITPEASGNNKDIHETTGSVIAYTTQADVKATYHYLKKYSKGSHCRFLLYPDSCRNHQ